MLSVVDLLVIGHDVEMDAVIRLVRAHANRFRDHPWDYSQADRAVIAEAVRWRRSGPRPPIPTALSQALAEALLREIPRLDVDQAHHLATSTPTSIRKAL